MLRDVIATEIEKESYKSNGVEIIQICDLEKAIDLLEEEMIDSNQTLTILYRVLNKIGKEKEKLEGEEPGERIAGKKEAFETCTNLLIKEMENCVKI